MDLTRTDLETRLTELRTDLAAAEWRFEASRREARLALVRGEDAEAHVREQAEAQARVEAVRGAIEEIETTLPQVIDAEGRAAAAKRLDPDLKRAIGSLVAEFTKDAEKVIAAAEALVSAVERLHGRRAKIARDHVEAQVLRARWPDLPKPDLPPVPMVSVAVNEALGRGRAATLEEPRLPARFDVGHRAGADAEELRRDTLRALKTFVERGRLDPNSETAKILQAAGIPEPEPTSREIEIAKRKHEQEERTARELAPLAEKASILSRIPGGLLR